MPSATPRPLKAFLTLPVPSKQCARHASGAARSRLGSARPWHALPALPRRAEPPTWRHMAHLSQVQPVDALALQLAIRTAFAVVVGVVIVPVPEAEAA